MSLDLTRLPRFPLANLPTPLQEAGRLRDALGGPSQCPRILIKRDDLTGLAFGGNKVRKLEFLVGDALAKGATCLITAGAAQLQPRPRDRRGCGRGRTEIGPRADVVRGRATGAGQPAA